MRWLLQVRTGSIIRIRFIEEETGVISNVTKGAGGHIDKEGWPFLYIINDFQALYSQRVT